MNASLCDDFESNDSKDTKEKNANYMTFTASMKNADVSFVCDPYVLVVTCEDESPGFEDEEINFQEVYNLLCMK